MSSDLTWLYSAYGHEGDKARYLAFAQELEAAGDLRAAATAYDRAYGLDPQDGRVGEAREAILDRLAIEEYGIKFRYIPAGTFLMGSETGDPDEQPIHPVRLSDYWLSDVPISWAKYCEIMGWNPPPDGTPAGYYENYFQRLDKYRGKSKAYRWLFGEYKIRVQYCENETLQARGWHAHDPQITKESNHDWGEVPREHPERPWAYDQKPIVSVSVEAVNLLCKQISTSAVKYRLPTEAEWEKGARGGLINARYPWGNESPTPDRCDFDRYIQFSIRPMWSLPSNGYGLYAMSGCVWEWTADWYDAEYYRNSPLENPGGPVRGKEKVLRGGSWADCEDAVTVSFRMSRTALGRDYPGDYASPNIGFRLCCVEGKGRLKK